WGEEGKKDGEKLKGTWDIVSLEADGEQGPPEIVAKLKLVFDGDKLTFRPGEPGYTNYTFKLDQSAKPPAFDMTHADGKNKGTTVKGIYALDGDSLKICFGKGDDRPKSFTTKGKTGGAMYVLKRQKP